MADLPDTPTPPEPSAAPPGEGRRSSRTRSRARFFPKLIAGLLVAAAIYLLLQGLWATSESDMQLSWKFYGGAVLCGLVAITGWWLLVHFPSEADIARGRYGTAAWIGFPLSLFGFLAMVPLLVLAISPAARERLDPHDRIRARVLDDGWLEVIFARATWDGVTGAAELGRGKTVNLMLDDFPVPTSFFEENPDSHRWSPDHRRLVIDLPSLRDRFGLPDPGWIAINAILGAKQILDQTRLRIPQQRIPVERR